MKTKTIDCLFIGHNDMDFTTYENTIRQMGKESGAYRDLNLNFIRYNRTPYYASGIFNLFNGKEKAVHPSIKPLNVFEPLSAAVTYLGTYIHKHGFTFDYINLFQEEKEALAKKLEQENLLTIAITTTYYVSVFPILEIAAFIRRYNRTAKIILGGPFVTTQVQFQSPLQLQTLFYLIGADIYVNSPQGEATLVRILQALKTDSPLDQIDNIYYKTKAGYQSTPVWKENNPLSENMVDWNLFGPNIGEHVIIRTGISCPFKCAFCSFPGNAGKYQTTTPTLIEKQLDQLQRLETVKYIHFIDDTFNIPAKRFKEILKMMTARKYRFKWHSYFRCQAADREMVALMKASGCEGVYLGLESGNNLVLQNMNKKATVEDYAAGIALLKEYGIVTQGSFIVGFPGETHDTVRDTIGFIKESGIDFYRVQLWYYLHHTPIWRKRDKYHIKGASFDWTHAAMDYKTACDLIDEIFLTMDGPTWVPQYNFDVANFWHLVHRGMTLHQVKNFLECFNAGIKEKLSNPSQEEIGEKLLTRLKETCRTK